MTSQNWAIPLGQTGDDMLLSLRTPCCSQEQYVILLRDTMIWGRLAEMECFGHCHTAVTFTFRSATGGRCSADSGSCRAGGRRLWGT